MNIRELGAAIAGEFRVDVGAGTRAAETWIRRVEQTMTRAIDRDNITTADAAAVLDAIAEARP